MRIDDYGELPRRGPVQYVSKTKYIPDRLMPRDAHRRFEEALVMHDQDRTSQVFADRFDRRIAQIIYSTPPEPTHFRGIGGGLGIPGVRPFAL